MFVERDTQLVIGQSLFTCKNHNISFGIDEYISAALNVYVDIIGLYQANNFDQGHYTIDGGGWLS